MQYPAALESSARHPVFVDTPQRSTYVYVMAQSKKSKTEGQKGTKNWLFLSQNMPPKSHILKSLPPPSKTMTDDQVLWFECELPL